MVSLGKKKKNSTKLVVPTANEKKSTAVPATTPESTAGSVVPSEEAHHTRPSSMQAMTPTWASSGPDTSSRPAATTPHDTSSYLPQQQPYGSSPGAKPQDYQHSQYSQMRAGRNPNEEYYSGQASPPDAHINSNGHGQSRRYVNAQQQQQHYVKTQQQQQQHHHAYQQYQQPPYGAAVPGDHRQPRDGSWQQHQPREHPQYTSGSSPDVSYNHHMVSQQQQQQQAPVGARTMDHNYPNHSNGYQQGQPLRSEAVPRTYAPQDGSGSSRKYPSGGPPSRHAPPANVASKTNTQWRQHSHPADFVSSRAAAPTGAEAGQAGPVRHPPPGIAPPNPAEGRGSGGDDALANLRQRTVSGGNSGGAGGTATSAQWARGQQVPVATRPHNRGGLAQPPSHHQAGDASGRPKSPQSRPTVKIVEPLSIPGARSIPRASSQQAAAHQISKSLEDEEKFLKHLGWTGDVSSDDEEEDFLTEEEMAAYAQQTLQFQDQGGAAPEGTVEGTAPQ